MSVGESQAAMSLALEEARPWPIKVYLSAVARGHKEVAQGGSSKLRCCVQMNAFVKQPDPPWTREQGTALSEIDNEEQVSLQSSATASANAQRTDDTAAWKAGYSPITC